MKFNLLIVLSVLLILGHSSLYANDQGNFTSAEISLIQNILDAAEDEHGPDNYNDIADISAEFLAKAYKKCWSVYIYDQNTLNGTFSAHIQDGKWIKWINFGRLNLSYLITKDSSVYNNTKIGGSEPNTGISFGKDIKDSDHEFFLNLLTEAVVFKGNNMDVNAQYIRSKLYPGNWNVYITDGS